MTSDDENTKDNLYDELSHLLNKHYKPRNNIDQDKLWEEVSKKIDSLFHKEIFSEDSYKSDGIKYTDEDRYWLGLDNYINNQVGALKHKIITQHLLECKICRQNHNKLLDKKKEVVNII